MEAILSRFEAAVPGQTYVIATFRSSDTDRMDTYIDSMHAFYAADYLDIFTSMGKGLKGDTIALIAYPKHKDELSKYVGMCKVLSAGAFLKQPRPIRVLLWLCCNSANEEPKDGLMNFDSVPDDTREIDERIKAIEKQMRKQAKALKLLEQARFVLARKPAAKKP